MLPVYGRSELGAAHLRMLQHRNVCAVMTRVLCWVYAVLQSRVETFPFIFIHLQL